MDRELKRIVTTSLAGCITVLMAGNIFFIKRLVDKIESTEQIVWALRQDVVVLKFSVDEMRHNKEN